MSVEGLSWEKGRAVTEKIRLNALKIPNLELNKQSFGSKIWIFIFHITNVVSVGELGQGKGELGESQ